MGVENGTVLVRVYVCVSDIDLDDQSPYWILVYTDSTILVNLLIESLDPSFLFSTPLALAVYDDIFSR